MRRGDGPVTFWPARRLPSDIPSGLRAKPLRMKPSPGAWASVDRKLRKRFSAPTMSKKELPPFAKSENPHGRADRSASPSPLLESGIRLNSAVAGRCAWTGYVFMRNEPLAAFAHPHEAHPSILVERLARHGAAVDVKGNARPGRVAAAKHTQ